LAAIAEAQALERVAFAEDTPSVHAEGDQRDGKQDGVRSER